MSEGERLKAQIELVAATSDFRAAIEIHRATRERVVKLARSLVSDPKLTDAEVVVVAWQPALEATVSAQAKDR